MERRSVALDRIEEYQRRQGRLAPPFTLHLDERASALTVPRQAVFEREGKMVVYRQGTSELEPVEVTLGPGSAGRVVIESGLAPGDVVALADPNRKRERSETPQPGSSTPGTPAP